MYNLDRLLTFYNLLQYSKYPVSMSRLTDELGCSDKQVYKLRRQIESAFKVSINTGKGGFSFDDEDGEKNSVPGLWFKSDEIEVLIYLEKLLEDLGTGIFSSLLMPIKGHMEKLLDSNDSSIEELRNKVKLISIGSREVCPKTLRTSLSATLSGKKLKILYKKVGCSEEYRVISPQIIYRYKDNWYVYAWCDLRNSLRTFSLNRVKEQTVLEQSGKTIGNDVLIKNFESTYGIFSGEQEFIAKIAFYGVAADEVSQEIWHPQQKGTLSDDGVYYLELPCGNPQELIMDIMRWGPLAKVIYPDMLKDDLTEQVKKMLELYN